MERQNKVYVIGTLAQVKDIREGEKDGVAWIAGSAVVNTKNSEIEFKFYSSAKTVAGKDNARYANYAGLDKLVGTRVRVNGELSGRVFYNEREGQIINFNEVTAGFFNSAKPTEEDVATFEYSGFVTKPLHERLNKEEKLVAYEMEIAQANYSGENMQIVRFSVDKDNRKIVSAIEGAYTKGTTVSIMGEIEYLVEIIEKVEEVAFGDPIVKKFPSVLKRFLITGGKQPIIDEGVAYSPQQIAQLQAAFTDYVAQIEKEAKERNSSGTPQKSAPAKSNNADRLL